jgi:hypothetical protein
MVVPEDVVWLLRYLFTNALDGHNSWLTGGASHPAA